MRWPADWTGDMYGVPELLITTGTASSPSMTRSINDNRPPVRSAKHLPRADPSLMIWSVRAYRLGVTDYYAFKSVEGV